MLANSYWELKCNLLCPLNLYINIGTMYKPNIKTCSVYYWNQNRNNIENKWDSLQLRYLFICLFIFDYKALFVCVKDRVCIRIAIPAYCFNIFGSMFGVLFCLLIKKLILDVKPSDKVWESFHVQFWMWLHFLIWTKNKHFSWKLHIGMV